MDTEDKNGQTPLPYAAKKGHESIVKLLLESDVNSGTTGKYNTGRTPPSYAAGEHTAIVKLLLNAGRVDVNSKAAGEFNAGPTPLSEAAERGCEAIVKLLLNGGADTDSKDNWGRTPLWYAAERGARPSSHCFLRRAPILRRKRDDNLPLELGGVLVGAFSFNEEVRERRGSGNLKEFKGFS
ncbi:hypothetical protein DL769_009901 [Monosporascus sp. CRB-8-3]|nr:hypothetical protein DL769_009901 [Monosporascus sp. CRB-8-3]